MGLRRLILASWMNSVNCLKLTFFIMVDVCIHLIIGSFGGTSDKIRSCLQLELRCQMGQVLQNTISKFFLKLYPKYYYKNIS